MIWFPLLCAAYLLGSIPTGVLIGRLKGIDVRKHGSGNVGATNVARVVGKLPGFLVLMVDVLKGWVPVVLLSRFGGSTSGHAEETLKILLGMAAVAGHIWNPFLQFQGGKGVATALGVLFGLDRRIAVGTMGVWITVAAVTRYVSVASVSAALSAPFLMTFLRLPTLWILGGTGVSLAIIFRHRPNFLRLIHREEHKIGQKDAGAAGD